MGEGSFAQFWQLLRESELGLYEVPMFMSLLGFDMCGGVVREHSVKTTNADYCFFHMEILYVDIYKVVTCSMNIL